MNKMNSNTTSLRGLLMAAAVLSALLAAGANITHAPLNALLVGAMLLYVPFALWWWQRSRHTLRDPAAMHRALDTITDLLDTQIDPSLLPAEIYKIACELSHASALTLWTVDASAGTVSPVRSYSVSTQSLTEDMQPLVQCDEQRILQCLRSGCTESHPSMSSHAQQSRAITLIPLPYGTSSKGGVVALEHGSKLGIAANEQAYISSLLGLNTVICRSIMSREMIRHELGKLRIVSRIMCEVGPQAMLCDVREAVAEAASAALDTPYVALLTIDPCMGDVEYSRTDGVSECMQEAFMQLGLGVLTDRSDNTTLVVETDTLEWSASNTRQNLIDQGIRSMLACPIRSSVGASGALVAFYSTEHGASDNEHMIEPVATQASAMLSYTLAIEQSRNLLDDLAGVNQELSVQATSDGLTGLANHRTLQQRLAELCKPRGGRKRPIFSVVMVDVDYFKMYNDTHGHQAGDVVLQEVARILASKLRQGDFAARYGGEEFALVIKGAGKRAAQPIADRIRRAVSEECEAHGTITISMGIAEFPADGSTADEILKRADKALYHAKSTGRNRVAVWGDAGCEAPSGELPPAHSQNTPGNILIVEPAGRNGDGLLQTILEQASYTVQIARDAAQAVRLLRTCAFDVALVTSEAAADGQLKSLATIAGVQPHMPTILVAGQSYINQNREALRCGASDVVMSPFSPSDLTLAIDRNLERRRLELHKLTLRSTDLVLQAIDALVAAADSRDHFTVDHTDRVTALCLGIADRLHISQDERAALELAAKLHDIGKLALPDSVLGNQSELSSTEWTALRQHPSLGSKIVGAIDDLAYVSAIIRHHHERLDGSGYPDGLRGSAIPYLARVIAVADAYEAMTSTQTTRVQVAPQAAIDELRERAGIHYEPEVVAALEAHLCANGTLPAPSLDAAA